MMRGLPNKKSKGFDQVRTGPSPDPSGSLRRYARKRGIPLKQERDQAWEAVVVTSTSVVDTNVILRHLLRDDERMYQRFEARLPKWRG